MRMTRTDRVMQLLGLARRAGALAPGTESVRQSIRSGQARLVLLAGDASKVQLDKIGRTLHGRTIPRARLGDRNMVGAAVGLAPLSAVAVTSAPLAEQMVAELGDLLVYDSVAVEG
jgi:ribosomal protein L7Ae-like RNA K-turn-binding protein